MTEHTFVCYLGLWQAINVNLSQNLHFPLPPVARIIPLLTSFWNTLKGGGDIISRLDDICQERLEIRTDITITCARILLNLGVVFHRCNQMLTSQHPKNYPTRYHSCNSARHRYTTKQSLKVYYNILMERANIDVKVGKKEEAPFELSNCCPSPAEPPNRKSSRKIAAGTHMIRLPCVAALSGSTPGQGRSISHPSVEFIDRCKKCDCCYPAKRYLKNTKRNAGGKKNKDKVQKKVDYGRPCHFYKRKTMYFCFRCWRYLCNESPLNGRGRDNKKYPKQFSVRVPKLATDGWVWKSRLWRGVWRVVMLAHCTPRMLEVNIREWIKDCKRVGRKEGGVGGETRCNE